MIRIFNNLKKLEEIKTQNGTLTFWLSQRLLDDECDAFVKNSDFGHFEQTSRWAKTKKNFNWESYRILQSRDQQIIVGFQILWKYNTAFTKLGLLKKGPIIIERNPYLIRLIINFLKRTIHNNFLAAIVQPSDFDEELSSLMINSGFIPNLLCGMIKCANVLVDLNLTDEQIFQKKKRQKRQNINAAQKAGIIIRQGKKIEIGIFFNLMKHTCLRRGVRPNPPSKETLKIIWDSFYQSNQIALFFAEYQNNIISGAMVIILGKIAFLWKFGWSGPFSYMRPNELLFWKIFKWAKSRGYRFVDLGEFGSYQANINITYAELENFKNYQDLNFKLGFGGDIIKLKLGLVYFSCNLSESLYNNILPTLIRIPIIKTYVYGSL
ncbi:MAG: peptidoglycan bridge formation glycyltransferase FemA/FemB family protein [Candidatus Aminicenantes bacterium]|nr:peptidoglycan bridge formation glycyltransferase FemA/FemB family protein [Candidatus Aminicenantes bacterium]